MRRKLLTWGQLVGAAVVLGVLVLRLGTGPFLAGLRSVNGEALAGAAGLAVLTTVGYAWRWKLVASGLGVDLPLSAAIAAYYRALFLNATLPGGIVGDVHRGVSHGRDVRDVGLALRAVAWERFAGQVVQLLLTVIVLLVLPSPVHSFMPWLAVALGSAAVVALLLGRRQLPSARSRWSRLRRAVADDIRTGLLARRAWPGIALASALGLGGHAATFLLAARTVGATAPPSRMLPIALLVIAAMTLPSIGGWGPREGVAAWVFAAAGLGAQRGLAAAVVYGVMILVATLPGAAVLVVAWFHRNPSPQPAEPALREGAARA
ncbi:MAG TPA: lysylphosphatidylglycerol synthase transmembrane domain-containing protein [Solirubrobacteraceae bacterium]|nr:lysylphosphatidylglycerol synthase transmembrane domain-containing protein [Solirubrobacteraceae bacterium]